MVGLSDQLDDEKVTRFDKAMLALKQKLDAMTPAELQAHCKQHKLKACVNKSAAVFPTAKAEVGGAIMAESHANQADMSVASALRKETPAGKLAQVARAMETKHGKVEATDASGAAEAGAASSTDAAHTGLESHAAWAGRLQALERKRDTALALTACQRRLLQAMLQTRFIEHGDAQPQGTGLELLSLVPGAAKTSSPSVEQTLAGHYS